MRSGVDGIHAEMETEVSSVIGTDVYQHAASVYQAGSGESGSEALARRSHILQGVLELHSGRNQCRPVQGQSCTTSAGANGGGTMRGDSVAAMWPTLEVIRDIYTQASQGVVLTWVASVGCQGRVPFGVPTSAWPSRSPNGRGR